MPAIVGDVWAADASDETVTVYAIKQVQVRDGDVGFDEFTIGEVTLSPQGKINEVGKYFVKPSGTGNPNDIGIYHNATEREVVTLVYKGITGYSIVKGGTEFATVEKSVDVWSKKVSDDFFLDLPGPNDIDIVGHPLMMDFEFHRRNNAPEKNPVAFVTQSDGDVFGQDEYLVRIRDGEDVEAILGTCIVIDACTVDVRREQFGEKKTSVQTRMGDRQTTEKPEQLFRKLFFKFGLEVITEVIHEAINEALH